MSTSPETRPGGALRVVVVSGNPRPGSRTLTAARAVADAVAAEVGAGRDTAPVVSVIEVSALAHELFAADHPATDAALAQLAGADVAVVATPVYKASYTGLLKSFLDLYRAGDLASVVAVPLVVSASPAHALAGEVHLRPLLVELGAVVPTRAVAITEGQLAELDTVVDGWLAGAARPLTAAVEGVAPSARRDLAEVAR